MKTAVVGFGFMGMTHTINILKNPKMELTGIVVRNPENVNRRIKENSGNFSTGELTREDIEKIKVYSDLEACLENDKPDAVVIAVHTASHFEMAKKVLQAGAHVFVEKPFVLNIEEGEELIDLAKSNNKTLMIGHVVRFMPTYEKLKNWIDNKEFGELEFLSMSRFSGLPAWGQWKERQKDFGSSGGALIDLVIHDIDFAQWTCGIPDTIESQVLPGKLSNHDYVSALWRYKDSPLTVKIDGGNTFHSLFPFQASFSARFENASVRFSSDKPDEIVITTDSDSKTIPAGDGNEGFFNEIDYFAETILNGSEPEKCMPESALDSIRLSYRHI